MSEGETGDGLFITSDAARIAFTHYGAPQPATPRLVLIHSLALDRSVWSGVASRLRTVADILSYDCRGHGRSERRAGAFTAELFARDLAELLDHMQWPSATIAGCSMGGCVAMAFGGLYPQRASGLGLIDTTAWYGEGAPDAFRQRAAAARVAGLAGLAEFQTTRWFTDRFREAAPATVAHALDVFMANDFDCYAASCALLGDVDLRASLPSLRMPVSIVVGEEDYATPVSMAAYLHEQIPASTFTVLRQARHLTPIEHPDAIAADLQALLERA